MDGNLKAVGARIKEARKNRGLKQTELAEKLNISPTHMSNIETGCTNYGVDIFMRITEILQVSADELLRTNIPEVDAVYAKEFEDIAKGCTSAEKDAMLQTLRNMKAVFLANRK